VGLGDFMEPKEELKSLGEALRIVRRSQALILNEEHEPAREFLGRVATYLERRIERVFDERIL
jgi:hypothetical protein